MTKEFNKLDKTFNITPEVMEEETTVVERQKPDRLTKDDIEKDYDYTRGNLYSIIGISLFSLILPTRLTVTVYAG